MRVSIAIAALALTGCAHHPVPAADVYGNTLGLLRAEKYPAALAQAEEGLRRAEQEPDLRARRRFRLLKAEVLLAQRRAAEAAALLKDESPQDAAWTDLEAKTFLLRGFAAYLLGRNEEAEGLLDTAASLASRSGLAPLSIEVEVRQGLILVSQSRLEEAAALFRRAIDEASSVHDTYLTAMANGNLGYTLLHESKYDEALAWFDKAKELHSELGAEQSLARDLGNAGWCYYRLGDFEMARALFEKAAATFAKAGNKFDQQIWLGNIGTIQLDQRDYAGAVTTYRKALEIAQQLSNDAMTAQWLSNMAECFIELGNADQAERYNEEALALKRRRPGSQPDVFGLERAAQIAGLRKQFPQAEALYRRAVREPAGDPLVTLNSHAALADIYVRTGNPAQANHEFQASLAGMSHVSSSLIKDDYKFSYRDSLQRFYRSYVDFLMAGHQSGRALEVADSSRSRVLEERIGASESASAPGVEAYQKLARHARAVVAEYWLGDRQSYLWVITGEHVRNYSLPAAASIRSLTEAYRSNVLGQRNPLESAADTGRKLYEILLAPIEKDLCPGCRVILVPDQDLYSVNFESLPDGGGNRFWIEKATVEIAPSLDYLIPFGSEQRVRGKGLLVMGDPTPVLAEFPKLDFAGREIDSVRSRVGGNGERILHGPEARADSYAKSQPGDFQFIHFSAHATANTQSPLDSAVILSGSPDRCRLLARDVMSVPLTAELVTISACRSAGARTYAGEGLVGFAWAFLRAGARNVIAGLWDVNDRSTAQLMAALYTELAQGSTPADALRAAKLALIHGGGSYAKPYYWAPFQVYTGIAK
jgi:CHAT domain-containing protein/Tfp pilus assembly protein PilF